MVVAGCVHIEVPVHLVVDMSFFGCELQHPPCSFALACRAARRQKYQRARRVRFILCPRQWLHF